MDPGPAYRIGENQSSPCSASLGVPSERSYQHVPFGYTSGAGRAWSLGFHPLFLDVRRDERRYNAGKNWVYHAESSRFGITIDNFASGIRQFQSLCRGGELSFQGRTEKGRVGFETLKGERLILF